MENKIDGFRLGDFFISFPASGNIIEENPDGSASILVDIYRINKETNGCVKMNQDEITPDIQDMINYEVNKMLMEAIRLEEIKEKNNVKD
jgi:hypothetical protein